MNPSNTVSVATLIEEIQSELNDQTGSWRKVSELLNQADVEFGFGADEMKQILDQTDISPSKASKLISIAQDDRIKQNSKVFETVSAWTTLYQATLLNDEEFSELVNIVSEEGVLKVSDIRNGQDKKFKLAHLLCWVGRHHVNRSDSVFRRDAINLAPLQNKIVFFPNLPDKNTTYSAKS